MDLINDAIMPVEGTSQLFIKLFIIKLRIDVAMTLLTRRFAALQLILKLTLQDDATSVYVV